MNSTNPFVPQTSLLEQKNKNRARVKIAVLLIFAFNILLISPVLLIQACKRESASTENTYDTASTTSATTSNDVAMDMTHGPTLPGSAIPSAPPTSLAATNPVAAPIHTEPVAPIGGASDYVVVKNDNMTGIAKRNNVSLSALHAANPGVVDTKLQVGQKLKIPAPTAATTSATSTMASLASSADSSVYVVKSGDNLSKIATRFNTTPQALRSLNGLKTDKIYVGNKLKLPAKAAPAAASTTTESSPLTPAGPGPVVSNPSSSPVMTR